MLPSHQRKSWRERVRHFTWAWWAVIMGTGVISSLAHLFPFGTGSSFLRGISILFFAINLGLFFFVLSMTIARYVMFPEVWSIMIRHPAQSLFMGCFPMGSATLINSGLVINQELGFGGTGFLYFLWIMWWCDAALSFLVAFCMLYTMKNHQEHSLAKMTPVWLLPVVTLIVASSSGGNLASALKPHNLTLAVLSGAFSITMVVMGLSLALMIIAVYLLRLVVYGSPEPALALSAFIVLGPLGQGGYSLLVSGADLSMFFPLHMGNSFPEVAITGQAFQIVLFCGAYGLWSMGVAWNIIAFFTIYEISRKNKLPFGMPYWGTIFPHGVFAMLSVQLGHVLDSMFFKVFGALWSIGVLALWIVVFFKSIPVFIDGSIFKAPYLADLAPDQGNSGLGVVDIGTFPAVVSSDKYGGMGHEEAFHRDFPPNDANAFSPNPPQSPNPFSTRHFVYREKHAERSYSGASENTAAVLHSGQHSGHNSPANRSGRTSPAHRSGHNSPVHALSRTPSANVAIAKNLPPAPPAPTMQKTTWDKSNYGRYNNSPLERSEKHTSW